jgi:hypothetical protein
MDGGVYLLDGVSRRDVLHLVSTDQLSQQKHR